MEYDSDTFFYEKKGPLEAGEPLRNERWKILIADDEQEVHHVTTTAMKEFVYDRRRLEFFHAYSGEEAVSLMRGHDDMALVLLDVVMESDDAGLRVVKHVREKLNNHFVRIILRTGQPGQAPERDVIREYDINGYKEKSELTIQKLFTAVYSSLRSYKDIITLHQNKLGMERIIAAAGFLLKVQNAGQFAQATLTQLASILEMNGAGGRPEGCGFVTDCSADDPVIISGIGLFGQNAGRRVADVVAKETAETLMDVHGQRACRFSGRTGFVFIENGNCDSRVVYLERGSGFNDWDRKLIDIFRSKAAIAFDNVYLYDQISAIQESAISSLAKLAEFKDFDTGEHINRVSHLTARTARRLLEKGLREKVDWTFVNHIGLASILHDVGKVGVPEKILLKPGKLTEDETQLMRLHSSLGGEILKKAADKVNIRNYLSLAAEIAHYHHEKYDGTGYPMGLKGKEIPLSARIVAVADVYDALISKRPYKEPMSHDGAVAVIRQEAGRHFDPEIVEAALEVFNSLDSESGAD